MIPKPLKRHAKKPTRTPRASWNFQTLFKPGAVHEAPEGVVGTFFCEKRAFQLKLEKPELLGKLKPYNGKMVTLLGRPRVNGKYFVAIDIQETVANPVVPLRRPRGGGL